MTTGTPALNTSVAVPCALYLQQPQHASHDMRHNMRHNTRSVVAAGGEACTGVCVQGCVYKGVYTRGCIQGCVYKGVCTRVCQETRERGPLRQSAPQWAAVARRRCGGRDGLRGVVILNGGGDDVDVRMAVLFTQPNLCSLPRMLGVHLQRGVCCAL